MENILEKANETVETSYPEPPEFIAQEDRVVVVGFATGRIKATNKTFEDHWVFAITVRNGKVTNIREYVDTQALARASEPGDTMALLEKAYDAFNRRDIDGAFALMTEDVNWPKASEGGRVQGKEEIRAYWTRQWRELDGRVEPLAITQEDGGKVRVRVHQLVKNLQGDLLSDSEVLHVFTLNAGLIAAMDLRGDADPTAGPSAAFARRCSRKHVLQITRRESPHVGEGLLADVFALYIKTKNFHSHMDANDGYRKRYPHFLSIPQSGIRSWAGFCCRWLRRGNRRQRRTG
jgi:ketosteroid isomerase-like protein